MTNENIKISDTTTNPDVSTNLIPNSPSSESNQFVTLSSLLIVSAASVILTLAVVYAGVSKVLPHRTAETNMPKIVMLDVDRLVEAGVKLNASKGAGADTQADVDLFQTNLKKEIDRLSSEGYMVVNFRAVIAAGKSSDITDTLIARLGLETGATK